MNHRKFIDKRSRIVNTLRYTDVIKEESKNPVASSVEKFLDIYLHKLPHHHLTSEVYRTGVVKRNYWRALILTVIDRYGICDILSKKNFGNVPIDVRAPLKQVLLKVRNALKQIRATLASRGDVQRLQMQRPLLGRSLLTITVSKSIEHNKALRALLMTAIHPVLGVTGYKTKQNMETGFPFSLPGLLQDKLPKLTSDQLDVDVEIPAPKINEFIKNIFIAIGKQHGVVTKEFEDFAVTLKKQGVWESLGKLPPVFDDKHWFVIRVPHVAPGDGLLWSDLHASAGTTPSLTTPKITAFVDMVPSDILSDEERIYYRWHARHAPIDVGSGSGRGNWFDFVYMVTQEKKHFGLPKKIMDKFERAFNDSNDIQVRTHEKLSDRQRLQLKSYGYTVVKSSNEVNRKFPPDESISNLSKFFKSATLSDVAFDITNRENIQAAVERKSAEAYTGNSFFYYTQRPTVGDELNPLTPGKHSHMAQGGGSLLTANSGMGRGVSFFSDPTHVGFQFSRHVFRLLNQFYDIYEKDGRSLIVVLERFRVKDTASWMGGTHIDTTGLSMIPMETQRLLKM
jgi:hypothetical protein